MAEKKVEWHLDFKVNVAIMLSLVLQFVGFVWFMSALNGRVEVLERGAKESQEINRVVYTMEPTLKNIENFMVRIEHRLDEYDERLRDVEKGD